MVPFVNKLHQLEAIRLQGLPSDFKMVVVNLEIEGLHTISQEDLKISEVPTPGLQHVLS